VCVCLRAESLLRPVQLSSPADADVPRHSVYDAKTQLWTDREVDTGEGPAERERPAGALFVDPVRSVAVMCCAALCYIS
jgi:hypothetical protein